VINDDPAFQVQIKPARQIVLLALSHLKYNQTLLNLIFTSDSKMKRINKRFLNHNWNTDVLAFPFSEAGPSPKIRFLGEVIVSPKRAKVQAPLYGSEFRSELARYICHGILHLAGFKDKSKKEKARMRKEEDKILDKAQTHIKRILKYGH